MDDGIPIEDAFPQYFRALGGCVNGEWWMFLCAVPPDRALVNVRTLNDHGVQMLLSPSRQQRAHVAARVAQILTAEVNTPG